MFSGNMSRFRRDSNLDCKVYVGDLPRDASEKELERAFSYYGPLRNVWVAPQPTWICIWWNLKTPEMLMMLPEVLMERKFSHSKLTIAQAYTLAN